MKNDENRTPDYSITEADKQALLDRHVAQAELRQAESNLNFARALKLGQALKRLKGEA